MYFFCNNIFWFLCKKKRWIKIIECKFKWSNKFRLNNDQPSTLQNYWGLSHIFIIIIIFVSSAFISSSSSPLPFLSPQSNRVFRFSFTISLYRCKRIIFYCAYWCTLAFLLTAVPWQYVVCTTYTVWILILI